MYVTRIKKIRISAELGQKQLAALVGVAQTTISAWESGTKNPTAKNYKRLAEIFDTTVDYLMGRDLETDDPTPPGVKKDVAREHPLVALYDRASEDDKFVVDAVLKKYR